jgi:hypothetical protein
MTGQTERDHHPATTSGVIAVANLYAQIDGLTRQRTARSGQAAMSRPAIAQAALLVDLLLLRGQVLGLIADYERAAQLAEALTADASHDDVAWLVRARTRATLHQFPEALADLDTATRRGADRNTLDAERAAILQATGCYADALVLRRSAVQRRADFTTLGALAVLKAQHGKPAEAERLFTEAHRRHRGASPFPVASLDFRRALMWLAEGNLTAARTWLHAAVDHVPGYAPALGHLAELDAALGAGDAAIHSLRRLARSSDDPQYAAILARLLGDAGQPEEAEHWRSQAAARYHQLVLRHPQAFADHATAFWSTLGRTTKQNSADPAESPELGSPRKPGSGASLRLPGGPPTTPPAVGRVHG